MFKGLKLKCMPIILIQVFSIGPFCYLSCFGQLVGKGNFVYQVRIHHK